MQNIFEERKPNGQWQKSIKFKAAVTEKLHAQIDVSELETEMSTLEKQLKQLSGVKDKLGSQIDSLDVFDSSYDRKFDDLQKRLDDCYKKNRRNRNGNIGS